MQKAKTHIALGDVNKSALSYIPGGNGGFVQIILEINLATFLKIINTSLTLVQYFFLQNLTHRD